VTADRSGRGIVRRLTRELLAQHLEEAVRLDAQARREMGDAYSHETWSAEHFLAERPRKWELSGAALEEGRLIGLAIVSLDGAAAHLHRLVVAPEHQRRGIARALMRRAETAATHAGAVRLTLSVASDNLGAVRFYDDLEYIPLQGERLHRYAEARGLEPSRGGVRAEDHDYLILSRRLTA
jgi:ribosomal protein S18 acetylase RimI-like enzyme